MTCRTTSKKLCSIWTKSRIYPSQASPSGIQSKHSLTKWMSSLRVNHPLHHHLTNQASFWSKNQRCFCTKHSPAWWVRWSVLRKWLRNLKVRCFMPNRRRINWCICSSYFIRKASLSMRYMTRSWKTYLQRDSWSSLSSWSLSSRRSLTYLSMRMEYRSRPVTYLLIVRVTLPLCMKVQCRSLTVQVTCLAWTWEWFRIMSPHLQRMKMKKRALDHGKRWNTHLRKLHVLIETIWVRPVQCWVTGQPTRLRVSANEASCERT